MFETDKYESVRPGLRTSPTAAYRYFDGAAKRAFLVWGEHCIECAAPDCFSACDLYDARPDERCRRFAYGIYRNTKYSSRQGFGAEVVFKKWAKVEARGNTYLLPDRLCSIFEQILRWSSPVVNLLGGAVRRLGGDIRWAYLTFGLVERANRWLQRKGVMIQPDAFVVEVVNPLEHVQSLILTMSVNRGELHPGVRVDQLPPAFVRRLKFAPGYNLVEISAADLAPVVHSGLPFGIALTPDAQDSPAHLVFLSLDLISYQPGFGAQAIIASDKIPPRPAAKCVVFDLDNTLWDGVLLEGDVILRNGVAELFAALDARGILISIASKNSHEDAMSKLAALGLDQYLLFPQISWAPKSETLASIARKIDIGLDTFLFVDDNPFERQQVAAAHPDVEVLPDTALSMLLDHPRLQGSSTSVAKSRRLMYQQAIERSDAEISFGDDYIEFLRNCEIVVEISEVSESSIERVAELVQRTNQLNFSGRKYIRDEVLSIIADARFNKYVVSCEDKFGSYGIVGFALTTVIEGGVRLEDFMLSCRVQGKFIEKALFNHIACSSNHEEPLLEVNFVRTDRNALAEAVMENIGFDVAGRIDGDPVRMVVTPGSLNVDFLRVEIAAGVAI